MKNKIPLFIIFIALIILIEAVAIKIIKSHQVNLPDPKFWSVTSIDTMKYSRDSAASPMASSLIETQIKAVAATGATHVAIATPYDKEFLPRLKQWVSLARKHNLKVWFRGNFSGWEGWFGYKSNLTRGEHQEMTKNFILENSDLFQNGDIFTACPECENGGPGDPRQTGDISGFRQFMTDEYKITKDAFASINKDVISNYDSMNADVARLVMDKATTTSMDNVVTIDDYVSTPQKLKDDIDSIAKSSGGKIVLGEYGTPIPDINGNQSESDQANWIKNALENLKGDANIIGLNYWVSYGGTTKLWNDDGSARSAVAVITSFYNPKVIIGKIVDASQIPIKGAKINYLAKVTQTDTNGNFKLAYTDTNSPFTVSYNDEVYTQTVHYLENDKTIILSHVHLTFIEKVQNFLSE